MMVVSAGFDVLVMIHAAGRPCFAWHNALSFAGEAGRVKLR
jgi:hypothetical protein